MSAVSTSSPQTTAEQRAHEPSMEEILASIRRIIADDQVLPLSRPAPAPPARAAAPAAEQGEPVLRPGLRAEPAYEDHEEEPVAPAPAPGPRVPERREPLRAEAPVTAEPGYEDAEDAGLLSATADASISSSFNALATSVMLQNSGMIEDSIRDMLRPMLKTWLDDNLPTIVERLVRQEIERVARGRR